MTAHSILGIPIRFPFAAVVYTCISLFRIYFFLRLFRTDVGYYKSFCHAGEVVLGSRVFDPTIRMFFASQSPSVGFITLCKIQGHKLSSKRASPLHTEGAPQSLDPLEPR